MSKVVSWRWMRCQCYRTARKECVVCTTIQRCVTIMPNNDMQCFAWRSARQLYCWTHKDTKQRYVPDATRTLSFVRICSPACVRNWVIFIQITSIVMFTIVLSFVWLSIRLWIKVVFVLRQFIAHSICFRFGQMSGMNRSLNTQPPHWPPSRVSFGIRFRLWPWSSSI